MISSIPEFPKLERIDAMPIRCSRSSMPIGKLSYADWLAKYRQELIDYFMFWYQRSEATDEEWADYCRYQFIAERELELLGGS